MPLSLNGNTGVDKVQNNTITANKLSGISGASAWINFNGVGTVSIRGSLNVLSIVDNGTGIYTVNFITPMPNANYCCVVHGLQEDVTQSGTYIDVVYVYNRTTTSFRVDTLNDSSSTASRADLAIIEIAVFAQ